MKCYYYILLVSIWFIIFSLLSIQHLNKEHVEDVVYFTSKPCPNSNMIVKKNDIAPQPISSSIIFYYKWLIETEEVAVNNLPTYLPSPTEPELKKPTVNPENNSNNETEPIVYDSSYKWKWEGDVGMKWALLLKNRLWCNCCSCIKTISRWRWRFTALLYCV